MKYAILFSLLLVGVCSGKTLEQRYTEDDSDRMGKMGKMGKMDKMDSREDSSKETDSWNMKTIEDSQRQGNEAKREKYDSQSRDNDSKKKYDSKSRDEIQNQNYDFQRQDLKSQKQSFQKQSRHSQTIFGWEQRDYSNQKNDRSQKQDNDDQSSEESKRNPEWTGKDMTNDRLLMSNKKPQTFWSFNEWEQQISDYFRGIFGYESSSKDTAKVYSDQVPSFEDPLSIGELNTSFAMVTTQYTDVNFNGLKKAFQVVMQVDTKNQKIMTYMPLRRTDIKGKYSYSSRPSHAFTIVLADTVYVQTTSYSMKDGKASLGESSAEIQYSNVNSFYDKIGFVAQVLQGQLGKHLVNSVAPKLHDYVSPTLTQLLERTAWDVSQNLERAHVVSGLQEGVNQTFQHIRDHLKRSGNANVELTSQNPQEYQYRQYKAKFVSVTMQNFQDLNLISNNVSYTDTMVHSHVNISLPQPIISTTISYYSYPNTQTREIHAQYSVDYANASVELHKELKGGQLQLFGVKVNVSKVHAAPSQGPYEGDVAGLIDFLGSKLQHSIARSLESFLNSQVSAVLTKVNRGNYGSSWKYGSESGNSEDRQSSPGQYSGSGNTDMEQYGNENSNRGYSGHSHQQYPGKME